MSKPDKLLDLDADQLEKLKLIQAYISQAAKEFSGYPNEVKDQILDFHSESGSLNHCLRWGEQACEELIDHCQQTKKLKKIARPR